jgi:hypothetical protein
MRASRRIVISALAAIALSAFSAPAASATFHLMQVREVYPGSIASLDSEYVELQMWASGQNLVGGHVLRTYDANGAVTGTSSFAADVPNDADQSTMVLATPEAEAEFEIRADAALAPSSDLEPGGGAVCWESIDCVAWGDFSGALPSPAGPAARPLGIPDGMALRRSIAVACPTRLDPADDRDDSAADFAPVLPGPRPNSTPPSERPCGGSGGPTGGAAPSGSDAPETALRRKPPKRSRDRTPTFRFTADQAGASFECAIDRRRFRGCRSPFTTRPLAPGRHRFRVRAGDGSGQLDPSPASYSFLVLPKAS